MNTPLKTLEQDGLTAYLWQDDLCDFDVDLASEWICFGKWEHLGKKHNYEDPQQVLQDYRNGIVKPLYLYDHSGITISTDSTPFRGIDPTRWDWGQIGYACMSPEAIRDNFMVRRISRKVRERASDLIDSEVEIHEMYLQGEVYCYTIEQDGDIVDSLGGMYGLDYAIQQMGEALQYHIGEHDCEKDSDLCQCG